MYGYCINNPINSIDISGKILASTIAKVVLGIMLGFLIQLVCDLILSWFQRVICNDNSGYILNPGDYVASMLSWSLIFISTNDKLINLIITLLPFVMKQICRIANGTFNWGTFIIDLISAMIAYIVTCCFSRSIKNKIEQVTKRLSTSQNAAKKILASSNNINLRISKLGFKFSIILNISNVIIQAIYDGLCFSYYNLLKGK